MVAQYDTTDASCVQTLQDATSGTIGITAAGGGVIEGSFDVTFPSGETLTGPSRCRSASSTRTHSPTPRPSAARSARMAAVKPSLALLGLALMACKTDVSGPAGFGGQVVTGAPPNVIGMAAGHDGVLWTNGASIEYCPREGCTAWTSVFTASGGIARIVADDANVYFTLVQSATDAGTPTAGTVSWCPQTGCDYFTPNDYATVEGAFVDIAVSPPDYGFLALDSGSLYWSVVRSSELFLETCKVPACSGVASFVVAPGFVPRLVHEGLLYATQTSGNGISTLVSCPVSPSAGGGGTVCSTATTLTDGLLDVQSVVVDGATLYVDAFAAGAPQESVYSCPLPCAGAGPTPLFPSIWPGFAVQGGNLFSAARLPSGGTGFASCVVSSCSPSGPQPLGLPFDFVQFNQLVPAPSIVPDANGAYAYALYDIPNDSVGLPSGISAVVYLPNPSP